MQHGNIGGVEDRRAVIAQRGKCRRIEDNRRPPRGDQLADTFRCRAVLETGDGNRNRRQVLSFERSHQGADRSRVGGQQACFVEQDERNGTLINGADQILQKYRTPLSGKSGDWSDRHRISPGDIAIEKAADISQRLAKILRSAFTKETVQTRKRLGCHCRYFGQTGIGAVVARRGGEQDIFLTRDRRDDFQSVSPIFKSPETTHNDCARFRDHPLGIEVHGHRVFQLFETCKSQRRQYCGIRLPRSSES